MKCLQEGCNKDIVLVNTKEELVELCSAYSVGYCCDQCRKLDNTYPMYHCSENHDFCLACHNPTNLEFETREEQMERMLAASKVVHVQSESHFDETIASNAKVVVDFSAKWCGPCQRIK